MKTPLSIETLKKVSTVYTHAHCPDGMATAMILKDAFRMLGTNPRIDFLAHGTPEHTRAGTFTLDEAGRNEMALFCDIAPTEGKKGAGGIIVLDHHKGAEELVRSFGELGVFADEKLEPGVSGAVLAFREVWVPAQQANREGGYELQEAVGEFARCVGARDTWQTEDPRFMRGQWISKFLMSKPAGFWLDSDGHAPRNHAPYFEEAETQIGRALFEAHEEAVRQAVEQCVELEVPCATPPGFASGGVMRLFVFQEQASGFRLCSDVAETLRNRPPHFQAVIAGFSFVVDKPGAAPKLLYSLRGIGGFDVASFAKANGGGGHTAAAGFSVPNAEPGGGPYRFIAGCLERFLKGAT